MLLAQQQEQQAQQGLLVQLVLAGKPRHTSS